MKSRKRQARKVDELPRIRARFGVEWNTNGQVLCCVVRETLWTVQKMPRDVRQGCGV